MNNKGVNMLEFKELKGTIDNFTDTFSFKWLRRHGVSRYRYPLGLPGATTQYVYALNTKYGEVIANPKDKITYVSDKLWEAKHNGNN